MYIFYADLVKQHTLTLSLCNRTEHLKLRLSHSYFNRERFWPDITRWSRINLSSHFIEEKLRYDVEINVVSVFGGRVILEYTDTAYGRYDMEVNIKLE